MRHKILITLLLLASVFQVYAQCNPKEYTRIFNEAVVLQGKGEFIDAKNRYEAAKIYACGPKDVDKADKAVDALFEQINRLRKQADSTAAANRRQTLNAYANDLAYKSQIALRAGDRTTAFQIACFAHRYVEEGNGNITRALVEALYYNDMPTHSSLPWSAVLSGHRSYVLSVAFSPDGKRLATGSDDNSVKIWDLQSGKETLSLEGHIKSVTCVAFSPDGKSLATGSDDYSAKIWDLQSGKETLSLEGHTSSVSSVAFSPDGKSLATGSWDYSAKIWDLQSRKPTLNLEGYTSSVSSVAFSPDGKSLAMGFDDNNAKIWDLQSGKETLSLEGHMASISSVTFSPDGKSLATGSYDKSAKIWDLQSGKQTLSLEGHTTEVSSVAFSSDGKSLATGSYDKSAKIWDLQSGKQTLSVEGHASLVLSVALSPDGKWLATGSHDHSAKIWDLQSGKQTLNLEGHTASVWSVAFSLDGKSLATGSKDHSAKIWDLQSGKQTLSLEGHTASVSSVAFSPDGKWLVTGSDDNSAKIWEIAPDGIIREANKNRHLSLLSGPQLIAYNLETLLDLHPDNEAKLIATHEVWQIKAFADLAAAQAGGSNVLSRVEAPYARAERLYSAALALQDEPLIRIDYATMLRRWAEVYQADGLEGKAAALRVKADGLWKETKN
ncbi:MAG: WD40 repeat domain-containing protein [Haliscomenobacter sp.]|uniref:WD40 repeat domain-containing protein n=1 Tax=Haliscomenobacter sp. TaxID=2717303 RepID=UPI0029AEA4D8|nr:WD40 repeat domain-containing protein [Haliscomenobacter sp.]MDX2070880.1 WD40 repeat domain-containing protein [Haliscomenobacter sp.]